MELSRTEVFKQQVMTVNEFCEISGGVSKEAIYYAINNNLVDYIPLGRDKIIVLTSHTLQYVPNAHTKRTETKTNNKD